MGGTHSKKELLLKEIEKVPEPFLDELLDFIQFLKAKIMKENLDTANSHIILYRVGHLINSLKIMTPLFYKIPPILPFPKGGIIPLFGPPRRKGQGDPPAVRRAGIF